MSIKRLKNRAFTLIELLVVMAITSVMLTLIVTPLFQSINLTRNAQAFADAQDKGRLLTEKISREVGNAVSVRDAASTMAQLSANVFCELPYTKLDLIPPAQGSASDIVGPGIFRNPDTGKIDPTMKRPLGDIRLPVAPGATIVRWWVGLNDPMQPYNEPYSGLLMARSGGKDNLYVLRRAEVQPYVYRIRKDGTPNTEAWRPNLKFFHSDDFVSNNQEFDTRITDLDDKYFFVADGLFHPEDGAAPVIDASVNPDNPGKNGKVDNWAKASIVQTEISRYDMVRPLVQGSPPQVVDKTKVVPLIQFRPSRMSSTPSAGTAAARPGLAIDGLDLIGPDTYQTERGLWTNAIIRYYPAGYDGVTNTALEVASVNSQGGINISNGGASADGSDGLHVSPDDFVLFDLKLYERMIARGQAYPFTGAAMSAEISDMNAPSPGRRWTTELSQRQIFTPFRLMTATGKLVTSFPIEEVGVNATPSGRPNLPTVGVDPNYAVSPTQAAASDAGLATAPLSPLVPGYDVNRSFNRAWTAYPALQGQLQRFIDLRMIPNLDGTFSPLNPIAASGEVRGFSFASGNGGAVNRVRITPGSDEVFGPDQTVNAGIGGYASIVRYTRVSGNPGPNQYRLVYADLPEPTNGSDQVDYGVLGIVAGLLPPDYIGYYPNNVVSALIQPRYKAGYLQLCSDPNVPVPAGEITVRYRFQLNGSGDTFAVDYDTREIMQILLTIKNYPQSSVPNAQSITLKSTATLRNALR